MADDLPARIHAAAHLTGVFRLRSGRTSSEYFDKYRFESDPGLLAEVARRLAELLPAAGEVDAVAGLELGGVPLATALSLQTGIPALFVRKEPKTYGTMRLAEVGDVAGRRLVVVEDVVTSGGQIVESTRRLRELGARVDVAVCVIDRGAGGAEHLSREAVALRALFSGDDLQPS